MAATDRHVGNIHARHARASVPVDFPFVHEVAAHFVSASGPKFRVTEPAMFTLTACQEPVRANACGLFTAGHQRRIGGYTAELRRTGRPRVSRGINEEKAKTIARKNVEAGDSGLAFANQKGP